MGAVGGIGAKLLVKMGWSEGTGLGARRNGLVEPVMVSKRVENLGVGAQRKSPFQDAWWEQAMEKAYGKPASSSDVDDDLLQACEGRRCRPHGSAKLARLEEQDRKQNEEEDDMPSSEKEEKSERKRKKLKVKKDGVVKKKSSKERKRKKSKKEKREKSSEKDS